jgi:hypothetical protein
LFLGLPLCVQCSVCYNIAVGAVGQGTSDTVCSESRCAIIKIVGSNVHEPNQTITHFTGIALQPLFNNGIQSNSSTLQRQLRY